MCSAKQYKEKVLNIEHKEILQHSKVVNIFHKRLLFGTF